MEPGAPGGPAGPTSPCVEMTSISAECVSPHSSTVLHPRGLSLLHASPQDLPFLPQPQVLASCLALLPSCDSHKYFVPSSHPAIETGGDWPCRLSTSSPEPRSGGAVTTTLCSRMAPGPLFSVHLAVAPGKARTPRGGAALPPRPQCTGSVSDKHAPNKQRTETLRWIHPWSTSRDIRASLASPLHHLQGTWARVTGYARSLRP